MAITRDSHETIRELARSDGDFRRALLEECIECVANGEVDVAKAALSDIIAATLGFEEFAVATDSTPEAVRQTLGPDGLASSDDVLEIIAALRKRETAPLSVTT